MAGLEVGQRPVVGWQRDEKGGEGWSGRGAEADSDKGAEAGRPGKRCQGRKGRGADDARGKWGEGLTVQRCGAS